MKIGFYIGELTPETGGGFTFQNSILNALEKFDSNHEIIIFYKSGVVSEPMDKKSSYFKIKDCNLFSKIKDKIFKFLSVPNYDNQLNKIVLKNKIDFMWFLSPIFYADVKVPFAFTVWDLQHRLQPCFPEVSYDNSFDFSKREKLYEKILPRATHIITGTDVGRNEVSFFYKIPLARIKKIPFPVPEFAVNYSKMDIKKENDIELPECPFIFYPAQFWSHKNHIVILKAIKKLSEMKINICAVFTGSDQGNKKYIIDKINEMGLDNKVKIIGYVSYETLAYIYKKTFALVFPTYFGPDNLPPLEAMALGCPAIVSDVAGAREQYGDSAIFFDPKDHEALVVVLIKLLNDKQFKENVINKGLNRSMQFNSNDYIAKIIETIEDFEPIRECWR